MLGVIDDQEGGAIVKRFGQSVERGRIVAFLKTEGPRDRGQNIGRRRDGCERDEPNAVRPTSGHCLRRGKRQTGFADPPGPRQREHAQFGFAKPRND